jgi:hypothetical protein
LRTFIAPISLDEAAEFLFWKIFTSTP